MNRYVSLALFALVAVGAMFVFATPVFAQDVASIKGANWGVGFGRGIGAGLTIIGAGYGISMIGARAVESMARQPEVAQNIFTSMIIAAALIEGVTFFALLVCFLT